MNLRGVCEPRVIGTEMRKIVECLNCGEPREIAAHGLCFRCYRREERVSQRSPEVDRHSPGIRREQKKVIKAFARVMEGLADLSVSEKDVLEIKKILMPYLWSVAHYLLLKEEKSGNGTSEQ